MKEFWQFHSDGTGRGIAEDKAKLFPWLQSKAAAGSVWLYSPWTAEVLQTQLFIPKWEFCSNYLQFVILANNFAQGFCCGDKKPVIFFALIF